MRVRLRDAYTPEQLAELYPEPHQHSRWPDHRLRVQVTVQIAHALIDPIGQIADLSCGDAAIATRIYSLHDPILGDLAEGHPIHGPIEQTITQIPPVDLFVCCETLEHLDEPDAVLRKIRRKTRTLVISTPIGETTGENPEHYWGWDVDGVDEMLRSAGFSPVVCTTLRMEQPKAAYQIWGCE